MKLPPAAYIFIAAFAASILLAGLLVSAAGIKNSTRFFNLTIAYRIDMRLGRRAARTFCLMLGSALSLLGGALLVISLLALVPSRRLQSLEPLPVKPVKATKKMSNDKAKADNEASPQEAPSKNRSPQQQ